MGVRGGRKKYPTTWLQYVKCVLRVSVGAGVQGAGGANDDGTRNGVTLYSTRVRLSRTFWTYIPIPIICLHGPHVYDWQSYILQMVLATNF